MCAASRSSMTLKGRGVTITFQADTTQYKNFSRATQARVRARMMQYAKEWGDEVVRMAKKYCPIYGGNLEESIAASEPYTLGGAGATGRYAIQVGVLDSWKSDYDELNPSWGLSSPAVLLALHEAWEQLARPRAKQRAAEKGQREGVTVGSKYLTRAMQDANVLLGKKMRNTADLFEPQRAATMTNQAAQE